MSKQETLSNIIGHLHLSKKYDQAQRLFHGRGNAYKDLNHVCIDWLPPVILITLFKPEEINEVKDLAEALQEKIPECRSVQLQLRHQSHGPIEVIEGESIHQLKILEGDLKYHINLNKNRNTGLFLDMKNGRDWVQNNSKNKRVLNLFSYTCGFSVAAIAGGATSVYNIDMSSSALNIGRENHRLNNQKLECVRFEKLNIFNSFGRIKKRGKYDLLICDPPTFQKGSVDILKDYSKIIRRLDQFMSTGSTLMLCLNAPHTGDKSGRDFLKQTISDHAPEYDFIEEIKPPKVYIDAEDRGLKVLIFNCIN
ncbi:MAG: class I SAM-dependent methyltransferase [Cocleimonas sp.]